MRRIDMTCSRQTWFLALAVTLPLWGPADSRADDAGLEAEVRKRASAVEQNAIERRRDIHEHEHALVVGARTMATLAVDFLSSPPAADEPARSPRPFVHDQD
jgi:hypothetical protein